MRLITLVFLSLLNISLASAAVVIDVVDSGGDVFVTASGSIDTTDLDSPFQVTLSTAFISGPGPGGNENLDGTILIGANFSVDKYSIDSPIVFNTGGPTPASSSTGSMVGVALVNIPGDSLYVPQGYVSGASIDATATWESRTIASMGLIVGTHVVSWGTTNADTITINIGVDTTPPTLLSSTPADNATGVATDPPTLSLVFDEPVSYASGLIRMYRTSDDVEINNRSVSGSTGSGTPNISISFENGLALDTEYYVLIPAGAFEDAAGNPYAGIASTTALSFSTGVPSTPTYSVGGTVSGLTGTGLALQNNGADTLAVAADGPFVFLTELADTSSYAVTVSTQPTGQTCSVTNGSGTIATADVTDVGVACVDDVVPPAPAAPIPTLSQWALIMLSMLFGLMVFSNRKRLF